MPSPDSAKPCLESTPFSYEIGVVPDSHDDSAHDGARGKHQKEDRDPRKLPHGRYRDYWKLRTRTVPRVTIGP